MIDRSSAAERSIVTRNMYVHIIRPFDVESVWRGCCVIYTNKVSQSAFVVNFEYVYTHASAGGWYSLVSRAPTLLGKNLHTGRCTRARARALERNLHLCKCIIRYET